MNKARENRVRENRVRENRVRENRVRENRVRENRRDEARDLVEKLVSVRRVTKVVKGGKNMRFSALVVVGDGNGSAGYATAKAREVPDAVRKASEKARKTMMKVSLREGRTIRHDVSARVGAGHVFLKMAPAGTGVIAGGPMRAVFAAIGVRDIVSKSVGSGNYHNVVRATFVALRGVTSPKQIAAKLGKKLPEILDRMHIGNKVPARDMDGAEA